MLDVEVIVKEEFKLAGRSTVTDGQDNRVMQLWGAFHHERAGIEKLAAAPAVIGLFEPAKIKDNSCATCRIDIERKVDYMAAVEVDDFEGLPADMERKVVEKQLYARSIHKGGLAGLRKSYAYLIGTWLPQAGYTRADAPDFEYYGERFLGPEDENSEVVIYLSIEKIA